jgi:hypothetical protein
MPSLANKFEFLTRRCFAAVRSAICCLTNGPTAQMVNTRVVDVNVLLNSVWPASKLSFQHPCGKTQRADDKLPSKGPLFAPVRQGRMDPSIRHRSRWRLMLWLALLSTNPLRLVSTKAYLLLLSIEAMVQSQAFLSFTVALKHRRISKTGKSVEPMCASSKRSQRD